MKEKLMPEQEVSRDHFLSNSNYDLLKFLAQILLPALGALYFGLAEIWGLPKAQEVVGTIIVIDTFLGLLLGLTNAKYKANDAAYDGHMFVGPGDTSESKTIGLQVTTPPQNLEGKKVVRFKIHND
jgi:hypothetical protein